MQFEEWKDPNPTPVIERLNNDIFVVRDDLLGVGSKARFIDYLVGHDPNYAHVEEWCFGSAPKTGWGPISLSHVCKKYGKKATFFMAKRKEPTPQQLKTIELGGTINWMNFGMLSTTTAAARKYAEQDSKRMVLPIGLNHPTVLASIVKVARNLPLQSEPTEIWTVASGGVLSRGLQEAFPNVSVNAVQVGHKLSEKELGRAKLYISPYKYDQACKEEDMPPFPSEKFYDAKLWPFVRQHAKPGALLWNVA